MNGVWSKFNGLLLAYIIYSVSHNYYVALAVGIGYVIGESFGWGEWVGNITELRKDKTDTLEDEGAKNGIKYIATRLVPDWNVSYMLYCYTALVLRGMYWWTLALISLIFYSYWALLGIVVLALAFPISCELGHHTSKLWNFKHMNGGWEHSEVWYGLFQDMVLISLFILI
jgi:hypothetical protein